MEHEHAKLSDFLNSLAANPDREALFDEEPVAVMSDFGLSEHHQRLILDGTLDEIREAILNELGDTEFLIFMIKMK